MALFSLYQTRIALISFLSIVIILTAVKIFPPLNKLVLNYDEVHYAQAANEQFDKIYLGKATIKFPEFVSFAYQKYKGTDLLPPSISESKDNFLLRHFHGVLPVYFIKLFQEGGEDSTGYQKIVWKAKISMFAIFAISILCLPLCYGTDSYSFLLSLGIAGLFLTTPLVVETFYSFNFHTFLSLLLIPFSIVFCKTITKPSLKCSVLLVLILGLMFNTLETTLVIIFSAVLFLYLGEKIKQVVLVPTLSAFVLSVVVVYPGQLLSLDFFKSYFMYAYRILLRGNKEYSSISGADILERVLQPLWPLILILCAIFVYRYFVRHVRISFAKDALLFIGGIYIFAMTPFLLNTTYVLPGITLVAIWMVKEAGSLIDTSKSSSKQVLSLFMLAITVLLILNYSEMRDSADLKYSKESSYSKQFEADITGLKHSVVSASGNGFIVSDVEHILDFYMPSSNFIHGHLEGDTLMVRMNRKYYPIDLVIKEHEIKMLIFRKNRVIQAINKSPMLHKCENPDSESILIKCDV